MNQIDQQIQAVLSEQEKKYSGTSDADPAMHEMLLAEFQSRNRWLSILVTIVMFVILAVQVFIAFQFFQTESVKAMIGWATGFMMCWTAIAFMKLQMWININRLALAREVKRLELQVAQLNQKID